MNDAPLSPAEVEALAGKLEKARALVEATAGECLAPLDDWPSDAWGEASLAVLDDAGRLVASARRVGRLEALLRASLIVLRAEGQAIPGARALAGRIEVELGDRPALTVVS